MHTRTGSLLILSAVVALTGGCATPKDVDPGTLTTLALDVRVKRERGSGGDVSGLKWDIKRGNKHRFCKKLQTGVTAVEWSLDDDKVFGDEEPAFRICFDKNGSPFGGANDCFASNEDRIVSITFPPVGEMKDPASPIDISDFPYCVGDGDDLVFAYSIQIKCNSPGPSGAYYGHCLRDWDPVIIVEK